MYSASRYTHVGRHQDIKTPHPHGSFKKNPRASRAGVALPSTAKLTKWLPDLGTCQVLGPGISEPSTIWTPPPLSQKKTLQTHTFLQMCQKTWWPLILRNGMTWIARVNGQKYMVNWSFWTPLSGVISPYLWPAGKNRNKFKLFIARLNHAFIYSETPL